jgi:hypothetical protein
MEAMEHAFASIAARAASNHSVFNQEHWFSSGLTYGQLRVALRRSLIEPIGRSGYRFVGHPASTKADLAAGLLDLGRDAAVGDRAAANLLRLDGFRAAEPEFVVVRTHRHLRTRWPVRSVHVIDPIDVIFIDNLRVLSAARLIVESAGRWSDVDLGNAVDSSIRLGWTSEAFLRSRLAKLRGRGKPGVSALDRCLDGAGGESWLERETLRLLRQAGLRPPKPQVTYRSNGRTIARVDFVWPDVGLVVEVAGHGTHSSRAQRQRDAQRQSELALMGLRVLTFTYEDVRHRPDWMMSMIEAGL